MFVKKPGVIPKLSHDLFRHCFKLLIDLYWWSNSFCLPVQTPCFPTWSILLARLFTEAFDLFSLSLQFGFSSAFLFDSFFQIDNLYPLTMSPLLLLPCPHCNFILLCSVLLRFHVVITNINVSVLIYWKYVTCFWVHNEEIALSSGWQLTFGFLTQNYYRLSR